LNPEISLETAWGSWLFMASFFDQLWVVTSYYNPANYKSRLRNFKAFRRNLNAPLMVVELAKAGQHQLTKDDGDLVISLTGEDQIWQKERLINIGIARLPLHVEYVAWVDCDLILGDVNWTKTAKSWLEKNGGLLQLFALSLHLPREADVPSLSVQTCPAIEPILTGVAIANSVRDGKFDQNELKLTQANAAGDLDSYNKAIDRHNCYGMAWAARRQTIEKCGHYDRNIVGGGDAVPVFAALNRMDMYWALRSLTDKQKLDMLSWANSARSAGLFVNVDALDQKIYHIWHGDLSHRSYRKRYEILVRHDFDPAKDIELSENSTWRWSDPQSPLARDISAYFFSRHEDGTR